MSQLFNGLPEERLTHIADGRIQEDGGKGGTLLLSSGASPWTGFRLERHSLFPGHERHLVWPTPRFALVSVGGFSMTERQTSRSQRDFIAEVGSFTIWPGGHESASLGWSGWAEILDVDINPAMLERIGECELRPIELAPQLGIQDPHLASLVWAMEDEIRSGCPSGRLYGESISLAVAAHIAGRFSAARKPLPGAKGGVELATAFERSRFHARQHWTGHRRLRTCRTCSSQSEPFCTGLPPFDGGGSAQISPAAKDCRGKTASRKRPFIHRRGRLRGWICESKPFRTGFSPGSGYDA